MGYNKKNVVWTTANFGREYPIYDTNVLGPQPSPTPTPTTTPSPTPSSTPAATPTPTPSSTPTYYYYNVFDCNDPFGPTYVVRSTATLSGGQAVKVEEDEIPCYEVIDPGTPPHQYVVKFIFADCATCQL